MAAEKTAPLGVCDLCRGEIPRAVGWYTSKGEPRCYCSIDCRNAANSRAGAPLRSRKARERVRRGEWQNPSPLVREDATQAEVEAWRENMVAGLSRERKQEVEEGRWCNPALDDEARRKLSRPRKHGDDPVLHRAIEKLRGGGSVAALSPEEADAHRVYRRELREARADGVRAWYRARYHAEVSTEAGRARQRERWRRQREQLAQRQPGRCLIEARKAAGLSQARLARLVGVSQGAVARWERFSAVPRSDVRERVEELLGSVWTNKMIEDDEN